MSALSPEEVYDSEHTLSEEEAVISHWRYKRMRDLGLTPEDSLLLATFGVSWHAVERLVLRGCPLDLVARILSPVDPLTLT